MGRREASTCRCPYRNLASTRGGPPHPPSLPGALKCQTRRKFSGEITIGPNKREGQGGWYALPLQEKSIRFIVLCCHLERGELYERRDVEEIKPSVILMSPYIIHREPNAEGAIHTCEACHLCITRVDGLRPACQKRHTRQATHTVHNEERNHFELE